MSKNTSKLSTGLVAQVATAVIVNGERVIVQPGEPLPPLDAVDQAELVDAKAARVPTKGASDTSAT